MLNNAFEQFQSATKPLSEFVTVSAESAGQLFKKQSEFVGEVLTDSYEFSKGVLEQKDIAAIAELQTRYLATMKDKATANGKELYEELTGLQEKSTDLVKEFYSQVNEVTTEMARKATSNTSA